MREYFSKIELTTGILPNKDGSRIIKYISFVLSYGQYEFLRMKFRLINGTHFKRGVQLTLHDLQNVRIYI